MPTLLFLNKVKQKQHKKSKKKQLVQKQPSQRLKIFEQMYHVGFCVIELQRCIKSHVYQMRIT